jgi:hypothetical protein
MLLPMIVRSCPGAGLDATSPYGYPGLLVGGRADVRFLDEALGAGIELLADAGFVAAFVRLHPLLNHVVPQGHGRLVHHGWTVGIDLSVPEDELWSQVRPDHRSDIASARRAGCTTRIDDSWQAFGEFKRLYRETMERRGADAFYFFDDRYFDGLRAALGERLHLAVVELGGAVIAAALVSESCGIVQYHLSGSDGAAARLAPTKLLLHAVSRWARDRGNAWFHLGGGLGGRADSLHHFKAGFSPVRLPFRTLRLVVNDRAYRQLTIAHDPRLDPDALGEYFPAYRAPTA